jgi:uncharacterized membrane protein
MSKLIAIVYQDQNTAKQVLAEMREMEKEEVLELDDIAYVTRDLDGKVKLHQTDSAVGTGAVGGAFWGMLIGMLFFAPFLGAAIGAGSGALAGSLTDLGIDDNFIKTLGEKLEPGNSAIFMLVRRATVDKALPELAKFGGEVIHTSLPKDREEKLQATLNERGTTQTYASDISRDTDMD